MRIIIADGSDNFFEDRIPRNQLSVKSYYDFSNKLQWDNMLYYVDNLTYKAFGIDVDAYIKYDSRIGYKINENINLSLVGHNLTDHYHQEFGAPLYSKVREIGRSIFVKLEYLF